jgi:DNA-binding CsgD family transcriptional regulator
MVAKAAALLRESLPPETPMHMQEHRLCWYAQAEVTLAMGDAATALKIAEQLQLGASNLASGSTIPRLGLLHGSCLTALGEYDAAITLLQGAQQTADEQGVLPLQWRIAATLGKLFQGQTRRGDAERSFERARKGIASLAERIPVGALRDNFVERASAMLPSAPVLTPTRLAKQQSGGLTAREREIAQLVGEGKSNQEIADALFVGVRTVEAHITRILNKLDFTSRVQIATWVIERRLAPGTALRDANDAK